MHWGFTVERLDGAYALLHVLAHLHYNRVVHFRAGGNHAVAAAHDDEWHVIPAPRVSTM